MGLIGLLLGKERVRTISDTFLELLAILYIFRFIYQMAGSKLFAPVLAAYPVWFALVIVLLFVLTMSNSEGARSLISGLALVLLIVEGALELKIAFFGFLLVFVLVYAGLRITIFGRRKPRLP